MSATIATTSPTESSYAPSGVALGYSHAPTSVEGVVRVHRLSARESLLRGLGYIPRSKSFHDFDGPDIAVCQRSGIGRAVSGGSQERLIVRSDIGPGVERDACTLRQAERRTQRPGNPPGNQHAFLDKDPENGLTDIPAHDGVVEIKGDGQPLSRPAANQFGYRVSGLHAPSRGLQQNSRRRC